ncbi:MAG: hypothetical protein JSU86_05325, partial [Phycisphaerales bacterium]
MCRLPQVNHLLNVTVTVLAPVLVAGTPTVFATEEPDDRLDPAVLESIRGITEPMEGLDWEQEYPHIERAVDNIWQRNGWADEADRFARDLACEVAAIPPWEPVRRLNLFNERISARYGLSQEQAGHFQRAMLREAGGFLMRNAGVILEQTREGMLARGRGQPFTPQQVARWAKQNRPMILELRKSVDHLTNELRPMLKPDKQHVLQNDVKSFEKRRKFMDKMTTRWMQGRWRPEDWGLQDDPIHTAAADPDRLVPRRPIRESSSKRGQDRPSSIPRYVPHDPSTWFAYVLDFEKRFKLDAGQMSATESIHTELRDRATGYAKAHSETLKAVAPRERAAHEAYEPIRLLFVELRERL